MSKSVIGDAMAYIPPVARGTKARYVRIGVFLKDEKDEISLKIDAMPLDKAWEGWVNCWQRDRPSRATAGDNGAFTKDLNKVLGGDEWEPWEGDKPF